MQTATVHPIRLLIMTCIILLKSCTESDAQQHLWQQARLKLKADTAKAYCNKKGLNPNFCFLVDMSTHSGKYRFFLWDLRADTLMASSLCAHGYGQNSTTTKPVFSNVEGSYCSSLGNYKTGARSYSNWGINIHYKLYGLEASNSNAFRRMVVLHSHDPIPTKEITPSHLPLGYSQGCPVIDNAMMRKVDQLLQKQTKPTLLWIYTE